MNKYNFVHERGDYPLLAVEEISSVWTSSIKKTVDYNESPAYFIIRNGWVRIYTFRKKYEKIVKHVFSKISRDKKYIAKIKRVFDKKAKEFLSFSKELDKINWQELSNKKLIEIKRKYVRLYHETAPYGEPLPFFLKEKLQSLLEDYLIREKGVSEEDYSILMTPLYQSFLSRETEDLWKLVKEYKNNRVKLKKAIKDHTMKYRWILFDYASLIVDEKYFFKKGEDFLKKPPKILDYKNLKLRKKKLIEKYNISQQYIYYLNALENLFYLMDRKKEVLTRCHFAITSLYEEVARRLNTSLKNILYFFWKELEQALLNNKIDLEIARQRKKFSVVKYTNGKYKILNKPEAKRIIKDIDDEEKHLIQQKNIKGISASKGVIQGKICYLKSARENNKMKKGQVLLVSNTTPDFMPAIQKAKAIITNEGGLTCHAAVISRELGIPCIVGTKIATKVLKDGDLVEVDANKGVVKKLR